MKTIDYLVSTTLKRYDWKDDVFARYFGRFTQ